MRELLARALDAAASAGASYADVRLVDSTSESLRLRGAIVEALDSSTSLGLGVRVLRDGAWGYAASARPDDDSVVRAAKTAAAVAQASAKVRARPVELVPEPAHVDSWSTPVARDPFAVALEEKIALLAGATSVIEGVRGVRFGRASMEAFRSRCLFSSSEGSEIDQTIVHSGGGIEAIATADGDIQNRSYPASFRDHLGAGGYEIVDSLRLEDNAERIGAEAVALLEAPECPAATTTLVLDGHQTMLQMHESIGHPTELDRMLGMEAAYAGTSFLTLSDRGRLRYGSDLVNVTADATLPGGLGTHAYDDEGVAAQRSDLIRDGMLVGFQTSRETAAIAGEERSNGTMRAEGWENFPLIRMTNVNLLPGSGSFEDLLADVSDGIYMATNKSWSIDDKRLNFQFGCEIAWEIKRGRLGRVLKNPRYTGITPEFWGSCDAIAGPQEWRMWGTPQCGKGQPSQTMRVGHGAAPARFRDVTTGVVR